ncbi:hypothetical protein AOQ84DRAFT_392776 [Glonium stellatum]|uniref:Myb transcription factor n=1 Tax=Glonium stellatum TaxID=574774 RepID=A0A8E2EQA9_9PEZI|nr:hypothetical protein AOQ84DRAFT_392776 [Glonium stellatum]
MEGSGVTIQEDSVVENEFDLGDLNFVGLDAFAARNIQGNIEQEVWYGGSDSNNNMDLYGSYPLCAMQQTESSIANQFNGGEFFLGASVPPMTAESSNSVVAEDFTFTYPAHCSRNTWDGSFRNTPRYHSFEEQFGYYDVSMGQHPSQADPHSPSGPAQHMGEQRRPNAQHAFIDDDIAASSQLLAETYQRSEKAQENGVVGEDGLDTTGKKKAKKSRKSQDVTGKTLKGKKSRSRKSDPVLSDGVEIAASCNVETGPVQKKDKKRRVTQARAEVSTPVQPSSTNITRPPTTSAGVSEPSHVPHDSLGEHGGGRLKKSTGSKKRKRQLEDVPAAVSDLEAATESGNRVHPDPAAESRAPPITPSRTPVRKKPRKSRADPVLSTPTLDHSISKPSKRKKRASKAAILDDDQEKENVESQDDKLDDAEQQTQPGARSVQKSGVFDKDEIKRLTDAINAYMITNGLNKLQMIEMIQHTKPKPHNIPPGADLQRMREQDNAVAAMWSELHEVLPNRTRQSIMRNCRRKWHNYEARGGKWGADEDELLKEVYQLHPHKWTEIATFMKRSPEDCRDRWRNYIVNGEKRVTDVWTETEERALLSAVHECVEKLNEDHEERHGTLKDYDAWKFLNWQMISDRMGGRRSRLQCSYKFRKLHERQSQIDSHPDDEAAASAAADQSPETSQKKSSWRVDQAKKNWKKMLPGDKYSILQDIVDSETIEEANIPWTLIAKRNKGSFWTTMDRKIAFLKMKDLVHEQDSLEELLNALKDYFRVHHTDDLESFYQPTPEESTERKTRKYRRKSASKSSKHKSTSDVEDSDSDDNDNEHENENKKTMLTPSLGNPKMNK